MVGIEDNTRKRSCFWSESTDDDSGFCKARLRVAGSGSNCCFSCVSKSKGSEMIQLNQKKNGKSSILLLFFVVGCCCGPSLLWTVDAQYPIPRKTDGFVYEGRYPGPDSIIIDAFLDPVCPDSKVSWPPLKKALSHYSGRVALFVHPFALPYHDNAFVTSRALHIANRLNSSTTYHLLEEFFKDQCLNPTCQIFSGIYGCIEEKYYNIATHFYSRASVVKRIVKLMVKVVGNSLTQIEAGFEDRETDLATRVSFKYGCSRGVTGTPYFFLNGFPLPDFGSNSTDDYRKWLSFIDPLLGKKKQRKEEKLHFFL
ncbi:hypothetical protein ACLOJK_016597 [Asimina triloba]